MFMHIKKTYAMAAAALMAALSVVLLLIGVYIPVNKLFFTAMAAYLAGYTINKYGIKYGGAQLVVCALLDMFFIPDKLNWIVYLCLSGYIFFSEVIFQRWNRVRDRKKKMRVQLVCNGILFNMIYIPVLMFGRQLLFTGEMPAGSIVLWLAGQVGWIIYDKGYRVFIQTVGERTGG